LDISINGRPVGPKHLTFIIAEGCNNHLGNILLASDNAQALELFRTRGNSLIPFLNDELGLG
jgi:hypothetical protein